jgi:hypothetical protein
MCFADETSVALAIQMLDGVPLRPKPGQSVTSSSQLTGEAGGWPLTVTQAEFRDKSGNAVLGHTLAADSMRQAVPSAKPSSGASSGPAESEEAVAFPDMPKRARVVVAAEATRHARMAWDAGGSVAPIVKKHDLRTIVVQGVLAEEGTAALRQQRETGGGPSSEPLRVLEAMQQAVVSECVRFGRCSAAASSHTRGGSVLVEFESAARAQAAVTTIQRDESAAAESSSLDSGALLLQPDQWTSQFWDGSRFK